MSEIDTKEKAHGLSEQMEQNDSTPSLVGTKSPGVVRIEALAAHSSIFDRSFVFLGVFLLAYAYSLDGTLRYAYQPFATSKFQNHSLLSTINVVKAVIAAAAQVSFYLW
jgi:SIT family siderophore-iron:H+ symporter-like MFS transporter